MNLTKLWNKDWSNHVESDQIHWIF